MISVLEEFLITKGIYMLTFVLMALGVYGMIVCSNYMKKLICMNILQVSIIFFFLILGQKYGSTLPVLLEGNTDPEVYINPLPHALMLTAIVVGMGTSGVGLALLMKMKDIYGTIEEVKISGNADKSKDSATKGSGAEGFGAEGEATEDTAAKDIDANSTDAKLHAAESKNVEDITAERTTAKRGDVRMESTEGAKDAEATEAKSAKEKEGEDVK